MFCDLFLVTYGHAFFKSVGKVDLTDTLNMFVKSKEYFVGTFQNKFYLKEWGLIRIFKLILSFTCFFQNLKFFLFSRYYLIGVTIFFLQKQKSRLGGPFRYLDHVRKVHRKFLQAFEKKFLVQKMRFCQNIQTPSWASFYKISIFFTFPDI